MSNSIFCGRFGRHPSRRRRVSGQNLQRKTNRRHVPNMETQKPPPSSSFVASFWVFFFFFSPGRRRAGTCPSKDHDSGSSITSNPSAPNHRDQKKKNQDDHVVDSSITGKSRRFIQFVLDVSTLDRCRLSTGFFFTAFSRLFFSDSAWPARLSLLFHCSLSVDQVATMFAGLAGFSHLFLHMAMARIMQ